jgi:hypothetical protein
MTKNDGRGLRPDLSYLVTPELQNAIKFLLVAVFCFVSFGKSARVPHAIRFPCENPEPALGMKAFGAMAFRLISSEELSRCKPTSSEAQMTRKARIYGASGGMDEVSSPLPGRGMTAFHNMVAKTETSLQRTESQWLRSGPSSHIPLPYPQPLS